VTELHGWSIVAPAQAAAQRGSAPLGEFPGRQNRRHTSPGQCQEPRGEWPCVVARESAPVAPRISYNMHSQLPTDRKITGQE